MLSNLNFDKKKNDKMIMKNATVSSIQQPFNLI